MADAPAPVAVRLVHEVAGRIRFRLLAAHERAVLTDLADRLRAVPGVESVIIRPNTGSVILGCEAPTGQVRAAIEAAGHLLIRPAEPPEPAVPVAAVAQLGLWQADAVVRERTRGAFTLRSGLATVLFAAGVVQLFRGQIVGPGVTLLLQALSMLESDEDGGAGAGEGPATGADDGGSDG